MSLDTPTTVELSDNIIAQLEATLNQTIPLLPRSFLRVLAKVLGAVFILIYKYAGFSFLQMFVSQASNDPTEINGRVVIPLQEFGVLIGVGLPRAATNAVLTIDITVLEQVGNLNQGEQLIFSETGVVYITVTSIALNAPVVSVDIRAVADQQDGGGSGVLGNAPVGSEITFVSPLTRVVRETVVTVAVVTGANPESTGLYRNRVVDQWQKVPQGGAYRDYELWAEEVAGIINAYPFTGVLPGTVELYTEATVESSGNPDGIPTAAQLTQVFNSTQLDQDGLATRRQVSALVLSLPIVRVGFDIRVLGIQDVDDLAQVQSDVFDELTIYMASVENFIVGLTIPPSNAYVSRAAMEGRISDIVQAAGGFFSVVIFTLTNVVQDIYFLQEGEKAKANSILFV